VFRASSYPSDEPRSSATSSSCSLSTESTSRPWNRRHFFAGPESAAAKFHRRRTSSGQANLPGVPRVIPRSGWTSPRPFPSLAVVASEPASPLLPWPGCPGLWPAWPAMWPRAPPVSDRGSFRPRCKKSTHLFI
jgi:hypothetical protein